MYTLAPAIAPQFCGDAARSFKDRNASWRVVVGWRKWLVEERLDFSLFPTPLKSVS